MLAGQHLFSDPHQPYWQTLDVLDLRDARNYGPYFLLVPRSRNQRENPGADRGILGEVRAIAEISSRCTSSMASSLLRSVNSMPFASRPMAVMLSF